jgi:two-component system sensor histidine kinase VicK
MYINKSPSAETLRALETAPNMYLILSPDLYILTASNLYLSAIKSTREAINGRHIFDAFPQNNDYPEADGVQNINSSLQEVLRTKEPHYMPIQRYDVPDPSRPGEFIQRYWDPSHTPVLNEEGEIQYIIQLANDVTSEVLRGQALTRSEMLQQEAIAQVQLISGELKASNVETAKVNRELLQTQKKLLDFNLSLEELVQSRTAELEKANQELSILYVELKDARMESEIQRSRLNDFFMQVPAGICILEGLEHTYELVNPKYQELFPGRQLLGLPVVQALPELKGTNIEHILDEVYNTGATYEAHSSLVPLAHTAAGAVEDRYFDFIYHAKVNAAGNVEGILVLVFEVTEKAKAQLQIQELNEELSTANEELRSANEHQYTTNQILQDVQAHLLKRTDELLASEATLRIATESANIGTWSMTPSGEWLTTPGVRRLFGLSEHEALSYADSLKQVRPDYKEYVMTAVEVSINKGDPFNIVYPITDKTEGQERWIRSSGKLMVSEDSYNGYLFGALTDITKSVQDRLAIEELYRELALSNDEQIEINDKLKRVIEQLQASQADLQVAIEAASLGTWDFNPVTGTFTGNNLTKTWFGLPPEKKLMLSDAVGMIAEDDRERVLAAINNALESASGGEYDIYYQIKNPLNSAQKIIRATGRALFDSKQQPIRLSGVLQDVTELKQDEQRKNDFIAMVSHELKTPLTSLNGFLQMLRKRTKESPDSFISGLIDKSVSQVKKMTKMINDFLNVSRLESGKIHIDRQVFDMAELVREVEADSFATITSHNLLFEPVIETIVTADRDKIGHVIINFISNAVKYSPPSTTIKVACITVSNMVQVSVQDQGHGVKLEDQGKLFDRYYRVVEESHHSIPGFGIGLYLCAEIISVHEGKIWMDSELGKGSTFYFSLPL